MTRRRLAFFSPAPPAASGIADYLADLLPLLPASWSIEVFVDDGDDSATPGGGPGTRPAPEALPGGVPLRPHTEFGTRHARDPYLPVYQVGNHVAHAYTLPYALEQPGLLVLHDGILHPARAQHAIETGNLAAYRESAVRCRADVGRALGHLVASGIAGPALFFRYPLCEDLVRANKVTAVHGELLAGWVRSLVPDAEVVPLVHWRAVPAAQDARVRAWRERLAGDDRALVGCFGYIGRARRLDRVIDALADIANVRWGLVVVGRVDPALGLERRARERGLADRVHWLGRVDAEDFGALLRAVDLAINLRFPPARASSGVLHQLLQVGVPTIISDLLHWREYPRGVVARVPPGPDEVELRSLRQTLRRWLEKPDERRGVGAEAERWAAAHLTAARMAESYRRAVELAS